MSSPKSGHRPLPRPYGLQPAAYSLPRGFTLIELLITVAIIAILASMLLFAMFSAQETAKAQKTRALVAKLDTIIKAKWEAYKTRRVPISTVGMSPQQAATARLEALRDLMRLELPDRWSDVVDPPVAPLGATPKIARPAVSRSYLRRYTAAVPGVPSPEVGLNAGAECLYLIVMAAMAEDGDARDVFKADNIADTDNDGLPEFVDGWGRPIKFLRWAPGFQFSDSQISLPISRQIQGGGGGNTVNLSGLGLSTAAGSYVGGAVIGVKKPITNPPTGKPRQPAMFDTTKLGRIVGYQSIDSQTGILTLATPPAFPSSGGTVVVTAPDPFDPMGIHASTPPTASFALYPLIYSAGPDKCYSIVADFAASGGGVFQYSTVGLNPFYAGNETATGLDLHIGTARNNEDEDNYVPSGWLDNIHNHRLDLR